MSQIIAALSWPHFAFAFALVFVVLFRRPLEGFLSRIISIDKLGIKTQPNPEAQREDPKRIEGAQELMLAVGNSVAIQDAEGGIRKELTDRHLETESETSKVLIKHLAAAVIAIQFEQVHYFIFGSQIFLLKQLNEVLGQGLSPAAVEAHFENARRLFPEPLGNWSLDEYLQFLLGRKLIVVKEGNYHITHLGNEYLVWIVRMGRQDNKAL